jgi:hypothetical protein
MRTRFLALLCIFPLLLSACGGGGGSAPGAITQAKASLDGGVTEIDGATSGLAGVELLLVESGQRAVTGADGSFAFPATPVGSFTIALVRAPVNRTPALLEGEDESGADAAEDESEDESEDEAEDEIEDDSIEDGDESSETEVELHRVTDGESIRLRLRINNGVLEQVDVSRSTSDEREVERCLERTDANDDRDMKACLEVEQRDDGARFELEVEHATPGVELELVVIDPDGVEESQGTLTVNLEGEAEWELRTTTLPFDVLTVAELEGYDVAVRDAVTGANLFAGTVPELPAAAPSDADDDDSDDDGEEAEERGKARLTTYEAGLEGYVEIESEIDEQEFKIEAEHLVTGREVEFFIEDAAGSGTFISLGTRAADLEGEAELELETDDGDTLPNGALAVSELVGLAVEVRDAVTGTVLLDGTVPALMPE